MSAHIEVDVAIVGAGHAGLNAVKEIRKATDRWVLINGGPLGTTCARVGCMPSKAVIELAKLYHSRHRFEQIGILGGESIRVDVERALQEVRDLRDMFVDLVLANSTDEMGERLIEGYARFLDPQTLLVGDRRIRTRSTVIASGSSSVLPARWESLGDRLLTVETMFEQPGLPESLAVIGLGPIGIEMGQAMARLGVKVTGIDQGSTVGRIADPEIARVAFELFSRELSIRLGQPAEIAPLADELLIGVGEERFAADKALVALGRRPSLGALGLERIGVTCDGEGVPHYDPSTLQLVGYPIFIAGDATGGTASLQKAADEGRMAGFNAVASSPRAFRRKTPMSILFTDPNIAAVGASWDDLDPARTAVGQVRFGPVGRAIIMRRNRGMIRLYADRPSARLIGGAMIGPGCEHLAHLLAWGVQQRMTVAELLRMPFYHPVIEEGLQDALHDLAHKLGLPTDAGMGLADAPGTLDTERRAHGNGGKSLSDRAGCETGGLIPG